MILQAVTFITTLVSPCSQMYSSLYHLPCYLFSSSDTSLQLVVTACFPQPSQKVASATTLTFHQTLYFDTLPDGSLVHGDIKESCSLSPGDQ